MPTSRKIWFAVSADEWNASASIAVEPDKTAATNLQAAMATLTASAAMTTRTLPPPFFSCSPAACSAATHVIL